MSAFTHSSAVTFFINKGRAPDLMVNNIIQVNSYTQISIKMHHISFLLFILFIIYILFFSFVDKVALWYYFVFLCFSFIYIDF